MRTGMLRPPPARTTSTTAGGSAGAGAAAAARTARNSSQLLGPRPATRWASKARDSAASPQRRGSVRCTSPNSTANQPRREARTDRRSTPVPGRTRAEGSRSKIVYGASSVDERLLEGRLLPGERRRAKRVLSRRGSHTGMVMLLSVASLAGGVGVVQGVENERHGRRNRHRHRPGYLLAVPEMAAPSSALT